MAQKRQLVTLLTDFGTSDYFVAAMKGAALGVYPDIDFLDVTHDVPPHDIFGAAYTLRCCYADFPRFTTHVVVVDPGVGSRRRPIFVMTDNYNFVGPDNGVFSYIYQLENVNRVIHLSTEHYFRQPLSDTFHGRDIFCPVAAWHAKGIDPRKMGEEIQDFVKLDTPEPKPVAATMMKGAIIHIDRFGNLVTNFTRSSASTAAGGCASTGARSPRSSRTTPRRRRVSPSATSARRACSRSGSPRARRRARSRRAAAWKSTSRSTREQR
jgi:S-adenosylmethionine hydrolase